MYSVFQEGNLTILNALTKTLMVEFYIKLLDYKYSNLKIFQKHNTNVHPTFEIKKARDAAVAFHLHRCNML